MHPPSLPPRKSPHKYNQSLPLFTKHIHIQRFMQHAVAIYAPMQTHALAYIQTHIYAHTPHILTYHYVLAKRAYHHTLKCFFIHFQPFSFIMCDNAAASRRQGHQSVISLNHCSISCLTLIPHTNHSDTSKNRLSIHHMLYCLTRSVLVNIGKRRRGVREKKKGVFHVVASIVCYVVLFYILHHSTIESWRAELLFSSDEHVYHTLCVCVCVCVCVCACVCERERERKRRKDILLSYTPALSAELCATVMGMVEVLGLSSR